MSFFYRQMFIINNNNQLYHEKTLFRSIQFLYVHAPYVIRIILTGSVDLIKCSKHCERFLYYLAIQSGKSSPVEHKLAPLRVVKVICLLHYSVGLVKTRQP